MTTKTQFRGLLYFLISIDVSLRYLDKIFWTSYFRLGLLPNYLISMFQINRTSQERAIIGRNLGSKMTFRKRLGSKGLYTQVYSPPTDAALTAPITLDLKKFIQLFVGLKIWTLVNVVCDILKLFFGWMKMLIGYTYNRCCLVIIGAV